MPRTHKGLQELMALGKSDVEAVPLPGGTTTWSKSEMWGGLYLYRRLLQTRCLDELQKC